MPEKEKKTESKFGLYSGHDLLSLPEQRYKTLVDRLLFEGDHLMIIGEAGIGKSIFALQMACCLSCGDSFMDEYDVPKQVCILYVQTEGKLEQTKERLEKMAVGIDVDLDLFNIYYAPEVELDTSTGLRRFLDTIEAKQQVGMKVPRVIFIDPLYSAMRGNLVDNLAVKMFTNNLKIISDLYQCSIVLIHHEHKRRRDFRGAQIEETGGEAVMGSTIWNNFVDTGYRLTRRPDRANHVLASWKDRNNRVVETIRMRLLQMPLMYFTGDPNTTNTQHQILVAIQDCQAETAEGVTITQLMERAGLGRDSINKGLRHWKEQGAIVRVSRYPARFKAQ